jgi:hypothetical protein
MSARKAARRRLQPYAWLGAGAVTLGMGAALVGGTAVAFADTGADSGSPSGSTAGESSSTKREPANTRARAPRAGSTTDDDAPAAGAPVRRGQIRAVTPDPDLDVPAETASLLQADPAPAAAVPATEATLPETASDDARSAPVATDPITGPSDSDTGSDTGTEAVEISLPEPAAAEQDSPAADPPSVGPAPAAAVAPAATDPAPNMDSWLPGGSNPGTAIVPGQKVKLALQQIEQSQALITQATWGAGNILAGFGAFGPQTALATAQLMLSIWGSSIGGAQAFVANTVGIPLIHNIAQSNLQSQLLWPALSEASLSTALLLIPTLGWFGADITEAEATVAAAKQNGKIYARVPIRIKLGTQPMVNAKINGGRNAELLLDTGASGLVTTRDKVGAGSLGAKTGSGQSCFSGGLCYHYETYNTTIDLGDGAVGIAPVNIVTDIPGDPVYANSVANFKQFFSWGADGILGVGANTAGPGPAPIPTAAMPGELSNGVLIHQNVYPFGLGGYMILGPNLYPTRVSLPGAPDSFVKVSVNGGPKQDAGAIIDTGGVYGTLNRSLFPQLGGNVPAGTKLDVYDATGTTLLYSYTTQSGSAATPYIESGLFNTGNAPYAQGPIYLNYGFNKPYGIGSTDFAIW